MHTRIVTTVLGLLFTVGVTAAMAEEEERDSRLRFKDGPVCMCSSGLSEADIRKGEQSRREEADRRFPNGADNKRSSEEER